MTLPPGAIVRLASEGVPGDLVDVEWNGEPFLIFSKDFRERAEPTGI